MTKKEHLVSGLIRKAAILAFLVVCLGLLSLQPAASKAAVCCTSCEAVYVNCIADCGDPPSAGCIASCDKKLSLCLNVCNPNC